MYWKQGKIFLKLDLQFSFWEVRAGYDQKDATGILVCIEDLMVDRLKMSVCWGKDPLSIKIVALQLSLRVVWDRGIHFS